MRRRGDSPIDFEAASRILTTVADLLPLRTYARLPSTLPASASGHGTGCSQRWTMWRRVLLVAASLLLLLARPAGATILRHQHHKQYSSAFFSLHKTTPLPHMDIGAPGALDQALRHRAFKNEIIVTCFTESAVRWMVHYGRMVQALGFDHFIVLTNEPKACEEFREAWCDDAETASAGAAGGNAGAANASASASGCKATYPGCAWYNSAALEDAEGWIAAQSLKVEALWLWRYHVAVEFLRRGVNVLMSDLDVIIHGDFYKAVKAPPLSGFQFLQMPCADSPNGGLWYVQGAHPRGPAVRMLEEAVRIGLRVLRLRKRAGFKPTEGKTQVGFECSWTDQDVIEYTMVAASHNASRLDWYCVPEGHDASGEWADAFGGAAGPPPRHFAIPPNRDSRMIPWGYLVGREEKEQWSVEELRANAFAEPAAWVAQTCASPAECARQDHFVRRQALFWPPMGVDLHLLRDVDPDPPPVAGDPRDDAAARAGAPPALERALYSPMWLFNGHEVMTRGWATPRPEPWGLVTHLVAYSDAYGRDSGGRNNRQHLIQVLGLWHAPRPTPARVVRVSHELARAAAAQPSDRGYRLLVRALLLVAAMTDREPVLPAFPCEAAPWLQRDGLSLHGVNDPHFFAYLRDPRAEDSEGPNALCTPMMAKGQCSDLSVLSDFHLDRDVLYPSYSHDDLGLEGLDASSGSALADAVSWVRHALGGTSAGAGGTSAEGGGEEAAARVLWLRGGPAASVRLGGADAPDSGEGFLGALEGSLAPPEQQRLRKLVQQCPDYFETEALAFTPPPPAARRWNWQAAAAGASRAGPAAALAVPPPP